MKKNLCTEEDQKIYESLLSSLVQMESESIYGKEMLSKTWNLAR